MTPEQQKAFLELVPTMDLYEHFKTRFDHCIIAGMSRRPTDEDQDYYLMSYTYAGAPLFCLGLAMQVVNKCQKDIDLHLQAQDTNEL